MGWTAVDLSDGKKPADSGLGPYREPAPGDEGAAVERPWRWTTTGRTGFLYLFTFAWNGILAVMIVSFLRAGTIHAENPSSLAILPFPLVGVVMLYLAAVVWWNRTRIALSSGTLTITRGPLPWRGRLVTLPTAPLREIYIGEYVSHEENEQAETAYRVNMRLTDGSEVVIDRGMKYFEDAFALVKWLETELKRVGVPIIVGR